MTEEKENLPTMVQHSEKLWYNVKYHKYQLLCAVVIIWFGLKMKNEKSQIYFDKT